MKSIDRLIRNYQTYYVFTFNNGLTVTLTPTQLLELLEYTDQEQTREDIEDDHLLDDKMLKRMHQRMEEAR